MSKRLDLTGREFGNLIVIEYVKTKNTHAVWKCKCTKCESIVEKDASNLMSGNTKGCSNSCTRRLSVEIEKQIKSLIKDGIAITKIAKKFKCGRTTVNRIKNDEDI